MMSGKQPDSLTPYYRKVNDELYAGRGKLTEELQGLPPDSVLNTTLEVLQALREFCDIPKGEVYISQEEAEGIRVALISRFISNQLPFISLTKNYITIRDTDAILQRSRGGQEDRRLAVPAITADEEARGEHLVLGPVGARLDRSVEIAEELPQGRPGGREELRVLQRPRHLHPDPEGLARRQRSLVETLRQRPAMEQLEHEVRAVLAPAHVEERDDVRVLQARARLCLVVEALHQRRVARAVVLPLISPEGWYYPITTEWVLEETRPLSKNKRWRVIEIVERAK